MKFIAIAAMTRTGVIGTGDRLPWAPGTYAEDMRRFRELTTGEIVISGSRTYDGLPPKFKPLPNRLNIVITSKVDRPTSALAIDAASRTAELVDPVFVPNPESAIDTAMNFEREDGSKFSTAFVIGGATIYRAFLEGDALDGLDLTFTDADHDGDVFFPHGEEFWRVGTGRSAFYAAPIDALTFENVTRERCPTNPLLTFTRWSRRR